MSEEPGRPDRQHLEELVHRARIELRDWTDTTDHDPGVALVELLAHVGDLLSAYSDRIADEAYLGSGRRRPSRAGHDRPATPWGGVHRATVLDDADPLARGRLLVRVTGASGKHEEWATACLPAAGGTDVPPRGSQVWVAFEEGDAARPVWLGRVP